MLIHPGWLPRCTSWGYHLQLDLLFKKIATKNLGHRHQPNDLGSFPEMSELRGSATTVVRPAPRFRAVRISYTHPRSTSSKHPAAERPNSGTTGRCGAVKVAVLMVETLMWNIVGSPSLFFLQKLATHGYPKIQFLDNHPMKLALRTKSPSKSPQPHPNPRGWKNSSPRDLDRHSMSVQDLV